MSNTEMIMYASCGHEVMLNSELDVTNHQIQLHERDNKVVFYCDDCLDSYRVGLVPEGYMFECYGLDDPIQWWDPNQADMFNPQKFNIASIISENRGNKKPTGKIESSLTPRNAIMGMPSHYIKQDLKRPKTYPLRNQRAAGPIKPTRNYRKYVPKPPVVLNFEVTEIQIG